MNIKSRFRRYVNTNYKMVLNNKNNIVLLIILITPIMSGLYGVLHDQITYTLSPEYYTNFKFIQFNISDSLREKSRLGVSLVGFLATWWVGIPIGLIIGLVWFRRISHKLFLKIKLQSILVVFLISILFGSMGYYIGHNNINYYVENDWMINVGGYVENESDLLSFVTVGSIHNYSYLGGGIGTILGVIYQFVKSRKTK